MTAHKIGCIIIKSDDYAQRKLKLRRKDGASSRSGKGNTMKFTKFDWIQLGFNILLAAAAVLNILYLTGILPQWVTFAGLVMALFGCVMTNLTATGEKKGTRTEVDGNKSLASLTYITGALWVITYGITIFLRIDFGG